MPFHDHQHYAAAALQGLPHAQPLLLTALLHA
jgi:hypothetical protein